MAHRLVEVPGQRLPRWVAGFQERHGQTRLTASAEAVVLTAADGAVARFDVPFGPAHPPSPDPTSPDQPSPDRPSPDLNSSDPNSSGPPAEPFGWLAGRAGWVADSALLLVRRGGIAVGVARAGRIVVHHTKTRYVQGRTAAGGWSQQRFARRRDGQTAALIGTATDLLVGMLPETGTCRVLVVGGDRSLIEDVLSDPRLARLAALPRSAVLDVPDPRRATLDQALDRAGRVRVHLDQP